MIPNEYTLVERPILQALTRAYGYRYLHPSTHPSLRSGENEALFLPLLTQALVRINGIPQADAASIAQDLAGLTDNARWLEVLRGAYSRKLPGDDTHRTIRVIDFDHLDNNDFAVTNQLRVTGAEGACKPDIVVYVNGIPLVVIEAKSPIAGQNTNDAIDQIRGYEHKIPRLFYPNLFNVATNDLQLKYGATGAPPKDWATWRDPWPRAAAEFPDDTAKGLFALLAPARLLDILAHFVVFETRQGKTVKKMCRYQQLRAVNKMVDRVVEGRHRAGLVWHTQGSGKSLTMVFAALKLKTHRGLGSERLENPNLLVITDRVDLHEQITKTFVACGLPNPISADSIEKLRGVVTSGGLGRTVLSTIFKFHWDDPRLQSADPKQRAAALKELAIPGSDTWIVMVDEAHRTQEKDLGAYLRAILPDAVRFGFTGTPVKKGDKDTFQNFGSPGEAYLDKYGIDDAIADGATLPIYYQARLTEWHLHDKELDVVFDQYFAHETDEKREELKKRGVTKGDLARFEPRIQLIAKDIWTHFRLHVQPDGFKAQICAIDRLACVAYKEALDEVITSWLTKVKKVPEAEARAQAAAMSVCVYSPSQHDAEQHPELVKHQIPPEDVTKKIVEDRFLKADDPLCFLIVCNKLLTGFDAPIEQAMYLDNPLTDHNLLQAIARTNRTYGEHKKAGLIVDYIGVSKKLTEALAAYRAEDVQNAMKDVDELYEQLRAAHTEVMGLIPVPTKDPKADVVAALAHIGTEDRWYVFRAKADAFVQAYGALAPDPRVLMFKHDLLLIAAILAQGTVTIEHREPKTDFRTYSEKIREMLAEHLEVTGLKTALKLRSLSDPDFWQDFEKPKDLKEAAVRKLAELKKEITDRVASNPARYEKFSDRIKALIDQFRAGLITDEDLISVEESLANDLVAEDEAPKASRLAPRVYDLSVLLQRFVPAAGLAADAASDGLTPVQHVAVRIDGLYVSDGTAPRLWHTKPELMKDLRAQVRRLVQPLNLDGWQKAVPQAVEDYALQHYSKS